MNTQNYAVNIRVGLANPARVNISQGDTGRTLAFSLYDGLSPFTPPTGSTVTIVGRKPSKLGFTETCTVSGNVATVATTLAMTQEAGKFPAELRIEASGQSIGTANFTMYVEPSPHPDGTTDGTHATVDNLQTQIGNLANLTTTAKTNLVSAINEAAQSGGTEVVIDNTLTQTGQAADAKKTGDEISAIKADLDDLDERVTDIEVGGGGGSGGSSTLAGLTDTSISNKVDGQVLTYDNTTHKWINKTPAVADNSLIVTVSGTGVYRTCDKTYTEIYNAISAGKTVVAVDGTGVVYPYAGLMEQNGTIAIALGISVVYDKTATLAGYLIVDMNDSTVAIRQDQSSSFYDTSETYTMNGVASYVNSRLGIYYTRSQIDEKIGDIEVLDGSLTTAKFQDQSLALLKFKPELSDKFIQNSDCAVSIMGDTALSYIQYTDLSTEISSDFFYDTSGLYNNWGSNPTETVDGKHGLSCSPFVMNMLYGVKYDSSAYINGNNRLDESMLGDEGLREYFQTPNIGTKYLATYALQNGYAFLPASDFSNVKAGDIIFTTTGDESDANAPYGVNHCEVVGYWINDKKFLVWHGGAYAPRPNVRVVQAYRDSVKLCARFPFANQQMNLSNIVNFGEADKSHTVSSSWLVADYGLSENIEPSTYYTAIFKMTSVNDIADQYPVIRDANNNALSQSYSGATKKPLNNIYCIPFYSASAINKIRLGMLKASDSVSYDSVTVDWMAVVKGIVTKAEEFISPKYEELRNDSTLLMSAGKTNAFTPTSGEAYASFGNCYYYKIGTRVHVHVGISGLTANTTTAIFTMPTGFIPKSDVVAIGNGDGLSNNAKLSVGSSGNVRVRSETTYALVDIEYDAFS